MFVVVVGREEVDVYPIVEGKGRCWGTGIASFNDVGLGLYVVGGGFTSSCCGVTHSNICR